MQTALTCLFTVCPVYRVFVQLHSSLSLGTWMPNHTWWLLSAVHQPLPVTDRLDKEANPHSGKSYKLILLN